MKKGIVFVLMFAVLLAALPADFPVNRLPVFTPDPLMHPEMGCTVLYAAGDGLALGGNNEDFFDPFTRVWFLPPTAGQFGRVYFGYDGYLWGGGVNDHGLFMDALAMETGIPVDPGDKPVFRDTLADKALAECDAVACVIDLFSTYHIYDTWYFSFMFGDAHGDSVIFEPGGFLLKEGTYQIATNFYQTTTDPDNCNHEACQRFRTARAVLESAPTLSVETIRDALDAVHFNTGSPTLYSNVYDLTNNRIHLYYFHDYETEVIIDINEELAKGYHEAALGDLFPENPAAAAFAKQPARELIAKKAVYPVFAGDALSIESLAGTYQLVQPGQFYESLMIDEHGDNLVLKLKSDKAWLNLTPYAVDSFYHVSLFYDFDLHFLVDETGQTRQFTLTTDGQTFTYLRSGEELITPTARPLPTETPQPTTPPPTETAIPQTTLTAAPTKSTPSLMEPALFGYWWALPALLLVGLLVWVFRMRKR